MNTFRITHLLFLISIPVLASCQATDTFAGSFYGSTPADSTIKSIFGIPDNIATDFIRWDLVLDSPPTPGAGTFTLKIIFGESKPNTLDFKEDHSLVFKGHFSVTGIPVQESKAYTLEADGLNGAIRLVQLTGDLLHILTPEDTLLAGNGGWNYTISRKGASAIISATNALSWRSVGDFGAKARMTYAGRTPCRELAVGAHLAVAQDCFKLKWKLTLNRDPLTLEPTTYLLERTGHRQAPIEGTWFVINGIPSSPDAVIYRLDPGQSGNTLSLLVGDADVLFFITDDYRCYTGNGDFSYTLNRLMD